MINKIYEKIKNFIVENYKFLLCLLFLFLIFEVQLPYVIYKPGGSINLNKRVKVEGGYESTGTLEMAYVSLVKGSTPFLLLAKILPDWDIVNKEEVVINDESVDETLKKEKINLEESIDNATIAAYTLAGKEIKINEVINNVIYIVEEANTTLKDYDQIISVDGEKIASLEDLKSIVNLKNEGDKIYFEVKRNGKIKEANAIVYKTNDSLKVGISIVNTYDLKTIPKVEVETKSSESGPSGGLMTSLSIYNALVKEDITKGRKIVGTGTISKEGVVGEIGGVKYKLMGAVKNKADIFLCPKDNYEEATKVAKEKDYDIEIVKVGTLSDAVDFLNK